MKKLAFLIITATLMAGCTTDIEPELNDAAHVLVIDAWITNQDTCQEIVISRSQEYFDASEPALLTGASVMITDLDNGAIYPFEEGEDAYFWEPEGAVFGEIGHTYALEVTVDGESFVSYSTLGRVPEVDSIVFDFHSADQVISQDYFTAQFISMEPEGAGDAYWIKTWKNDMYLGKPSELNMTYDAGFSAGQPVDGEQFIIPVSKSLINPEDAHPDVPAELLPPYEEGDSVTVEIHSLDPLAYEFLWGVYFQINRGEGFAELFSFPLANPTTNIQLVDETSTTSVAGFFSVSAVSNKGQLLSPEIAEAARTNAQ